MARRITSRTALWEHAIKMLPTGIPAEAIDDVDIEYEQDICGRREFNGYWIYLAAGYICTAMECHTIHEDRLTDLRDKMATVKIWADDPELARRRKHEAI